MKGRSERKSESVTNSGASAKPSERRVVRNAKGKAHMKLATALATVFSAGVYTKEELQNAVCGFVTAMKDGGESGEGVVRAAQGLVNEVGEAFPTSERTQVLLGDMVTWCLAEYYRESA